MRDVKFVFASIVNSEQDFTDSHPRVNSQGYRKYIF